MPNPRIISLRERRKKRKLNYVSPVSPCNKFQLGEAEFIFICKQRLITIITISAAIFINIIITVFHTTVFTGLLLQVFFTKAFNFQVHLVQQSVVHIT